MARKSVLAALLLLGSAGGAAAMRLALLRHVSARVRALRPDARLGARAGTGQCGAGAWSSGAAASVAAAAPSPSARRARRPFFEGWALRAVDARLGVVMVIIGSFRAAGESQYSSHLLVLQHHPPDARAEGAGGGSGERGRIAQLLMAGEDVEIVSRNADVPLTAPAADGRQPQFEWRARGGAAAGGSLFVSGAHAAANFTLRGLSVRIDAHGRAPWDPRDPRAGPEGWVRRVGCLLPCRYFVHSLGSRARVAVSAPDLRARGGGAAELRSERGLVHMEGNYGRLFPAGWSWVHALSPHAPSARAAGPLSRLGRGSGPGGAQAEGAPAPNTTSLLAVGGLFQIAAITTRTWILAFRQAGGGPRGGPGADDGGGEAGGGLAWDFRTTDGDRVVEARSACNGTLQLDARSRDGRRRLLLSVSAPRVQFGPPLFVPTAAGFRSLPGCTEAHGATVRIRALVRAGWAGWRRGAGWRGGTVPAAQARANATGARRADGTRAAELWTPMGSHTLHLGALEFGGAYTCASERAQARSDPSSP